MKTIEKFTFTNKVAIEVRKMNLFYGDFQALKNIDMIVPEKQITAMIGPSGCGKSTLLKSLNRMNDLVEGCRVEGGIQIGGVNETTGEAERLYFYDGMYLISTPAESFDPNMDGFAYIDFVYSDHFSSAAERSSHADLLLWDVVRH